MIKREAESMYYIDNKTGEAYELLEGMAKGTDYPRATSDILFIMRPNECCGYIYGANGTSDDALEKAIQTEIDEHDKIKRLDLENDRIEAKLKVFEKSLEKFLFDEKSRLLSMEVPISTMLNMINKGVGRMCDDQSIIDSNIEIHWKGIMCNLPWSAVVVNELGYALKEVIEEEEK